MYIYREILNMQIGRYAKKEGDTSETGRYVRHKLACMATEEELKLEISG